MRRAQEGHMLAARLAALHGAAHAGTVARCSKQSSTKTVFATNSVTGTFRCVNRQRFLHMIRSVCDVFKGVGTGSSAAHARCWP